MNLKKIKYAKQDIQNGTLTVYTDEGEVLCEMYQDNDGDFFLEFENEFHYLKDCQYVG